VKLATLTAIQSMTAQCKITIANDEDSTNSTEENSSSTSYLVQSLCPNDCNGNGKCIQAECVCNANYGAVDCSMEKG